VIEEGLPGRTAVFDDPVTEGLCGLSYLTPCMMSHAPLDTLVVMLGTNDTKERFGCNAYLIAQGIGRLLKKAADTDAWRDKPDILAVCPAPIVPAYESLVFRNALGGGCAEKAAALAQELEHSRSELEHGKMEILLRTGSVSQETLQQLTDAVQLKAYNFLLLIPPLQENAECSLKEELRTVVVSEQIRQIYGQRFYVQATADDLILINPHVMHTEFSNGDAALEYVVLGFEGIAFETDGHAPITCLCKNVKTIRPACLFYTRSLIQELHDRKENYVEMSQNLLENLLYLIRREIRVTPEAVSVGKTSQECRMIEQYINAHYAETITLDTLSALTFHSKYYIAHAFTKYKGISPINYLITRRIEEAKSLLEHTDFPVAKIAQAVGFSSQSYFSQAFRRETTLSPDAYRRQFLS